MRLAAALTVMAALDTCGSCDLACCIASTVLAQAPAVSLCGLMSLQQGAQQVAQHGHCKSVFLPSLHVCARQQTLNREATFTIAQSHPGLYARLHITSEATLRPSAPHLPQLRSFLKYILTLMCESLQVCTRQDQAELTHLNKHFVLSWCAWHNQRTQQLWHNLHAISLYGHLSALDLLGRQHVAAGEVTQQHEGCMYSGFNKCSKPSTADLCHLQHHCVSESLRVQRICMRGWSYHCPMSFAVRLHVLTHSMQCYAFDCHPTKLCMCCMC